ncbi:MAG TPA: S1 RNA-binding domain-containing protein [Polyangiaceae bacterium]|jgi:small subunit ribosomal protein S1
MVPESNEVVSHDPPPRGDHIEVIEATSNMSPNSGTAATPDREAPKMAPDAPVPPAPQRAEVSAPAEASSNVEAPAADGPDANGADVEGRDADSAEHDDAPAEGTAPNGTAPEGAASGEAGPQREKKRRRRRRGKKHPAGEAAAAPQAEGAEAAPEGAPEGTPVERAPDPARADGAKKQNRGQSQKTGKDARAKGKGKKKTGAPRTDHAPRERTAFHVGEEVFGRVTSVTEHAVMVDLSGKALAIFDRRELAADDLVPEVGDRFVAHVHGDGSRGGLVVLTRKPLREEETKPLVEEAGKSGATISGLVTGTIKGGLEVDIDGLRAFAPASHVELRPGSDLAHLIGQRLEFTVAQYEKRGRDVVVSRKTFLEAEAKEHRKASLSKLQVGSIVKGIVRSVVSYGAFVAIREADDVEGLVHMTEASHDRGAKLTDVFRPGAEIDVKVLRVDDKGKLWLSHKAATLDPWEEAMKTFAQGTRHHGKVLRLLPFGAFIELAPGIEGLMHTADLSFKRIEHPKDVLKEGEEIDVVVADLDRSSHKLSLHPAPPAGEENEPRQRLQPHKVLKVAVVAAESAGLVVRVVGSTGRQARGFIPAGHTGTERGTDLRKHFPPGMRLDAKVLEIDPRRGEAKLSLRAFREDTEKAAYNEYRASVAKASKFGTLGDLLAAAKKR